MKFKDKLKSLTIDNVIALVVGFAMYLGSAFAMANNFMPNIKPLWILLFFVGFILFMYNVTYLVGVDNLGKRLQNDLKDLSDGKIDGKQNGKPLE